MHTRAFVAMTLLLALLGCSRLTLENYSRIETGMAYEEVVRLIGKPEQCDDVMGVRNCRWGDGTRSVNVSFVGGKVLLFASSNLQ